MFRPGHAPAVLLALALGCGSTDSRTITLVRVAPAVAPDCGAPVDGRTLLVTALGDFPPSEATGAARDLSQRDAPFQIDSFPVGTRALEVVVIGSGGATRAIGRTDEIELGDLDDGAEVPVFMAPPRGFCATGSGGEPARDRPLLARARDRILVAGGAGPAGPTARVSLYDPETGRFDDLGDALYGDDLLGLAGAAMTELAGGRVAITGGAAPAYQVFDPADASFTVAAFLSQPRAHHAAVALDDRRLFLAAGCTRLAADGRCEPDALLRTSVILDVDSGAVEAGPSLGADRIGGAAFVDADGRILIAGGVDADGEPVEIAERLDPAGGASEIIDGVPGQPVPLVGGGLLIAFAPAGAAAASAAAVIPPGATSASRIAVAPQARAGASLTLLDDGRVLVLGGVGGPTGAEALLYQPDRARFTEVAAVPGDGADPIYRTGHAASRLADGTVLIVGGTDGAPLADAWIFRPDLTGPLSGDLTVSFDVAAGDAVLAPRDPNRLDIRPAADGDPAMAVLASSGAGGSLPSEWVLVGGPQFAEVALTARIRTGGGLALITSFEDPANYRAVVLVPGQSARLIRVEAGQPVADTGCAGETIDDAALAPEGSFATATLTLRASSLQAAIGGATVLSCGGVDPDRRGLAGLGVIGDGAELSIASVSVTR